MSKNRLAFACACLLSLGYSVSTFAFFTGDNTPTTRALVKKLNTDQEAIRMTDAYEQLSREYLPDNFLVYTSKHSTFNEGSFQQIIRKGGNIQGYKAVKVPVVNHYDKLSKKSGYIGCLGKHDPQHYGVGYYITGGYWEPNYDSTKIPEKNHYLFGLIRVEGAYKKANVTGGFLFYPKEESTADMSKTDSYSSQLCNHLFAERCGGLCHGSGDTFHLKPKNIHGYLTDKRIVTLKKNLVEQLF